MAIATERARWRNVRTAQDSVGVNDSPPRGEDQSNRDESLGTIRCGGRSLGGETGNLYAQQHQVGQR